jgi:FKBP-type peptidyl-prolyl cis-trans isomerase FkpA
MKPHLVVVVLALSFAVLTGCGRETPQSATQSQTPTAAAPTISDLVKTDVVVGSGPAIAAGQQAVVHYTGWLYDASSPEQKGKEFDSSRKRGEPFRFNVGAGRVIQGWDQGVVGMQTGGQRRLIIPSFLGYGDRGGGDVIPPNATLLFDVELLAIE